MNQVLATAAGPSRNPVRTEWLAAGRQSLELEAAALRAVASRLDEAFTRAVDLILDHPGKIVITGLGKSGHIGQKMAATFSSTGTPAVFLHAAEAEHGDLGVYTPGDPTILVSKSGATRELVRLLPILRQLHSPLIGILGDLHSPLAAQVNIVLDGRVEREADPLNLAPTSSSLVALALGDALAAALITARRFSDQDFARYHPGGQLGRSLLLTVADVMHGGQTYPRVRRTDPLRAVVVAMTRQPLGAACVIDGEAALAGIITDGDLRRALERFEDIRPLRAADVMTARPVTITPAAALREAARLMADRPSQISVLPVVDAAQRCVGLVRLHDLYPGH